MEPLRNRLARPIQTNQPFAWVLAGYAYATIAFLHVSIFLTATLTAVPPAHYALGYPTAPPTIALPIAAISGLTAALMFLFDTEAVRADEALETTVTANNLK